MPQPTNIIRQLKNISTRLNDLATEGSTEKDSAKRARAEELATKTLTTATTLEEAIDSRPITSEEIQDAQKLLETAQTELGEK